MTAELVPSTDRTPGWQAIDFAIAEEVATAVIAAVPDNTRRAYSRWNRDFAEWCEAHGRVALPSTAETLAGYVHALTEDSKGVSSVRQAIAAIRSHHKLSGYPNQPDAYLARLLARGHARVQAAEGVRVRQSPPILIEHLRAMTAVCDPRTLRGSRDRLILTLGWTALLRRSELVALTVDDVRPVRTGDGLDVFIASSKTDKAAKGVTIVAPASDHPDSDVVTMLEDYLAARAAARIDGGPLFRSLEVGGRIGAAMGDEAVNELVRELAIKAKVPNADDCTAHGLRAGGATGMYLAGRTMDEIIAQGRWAPGSTVVMGYIRAVDRSRRNAMRGVV